MDGRNDFLSSYKAENDKNNEADKNRVIPEKQEKLTFETGREKSRKTSGMGQERRQIFVDPSKDKPQRLPDEVIDKLQDPADEAPENPESTSEEAMKAPQGAEGAADNAAALQDEIIDKLSTPEEAPDAKQSADALQEMQQSASIEAEDMPLAPRDEIITKLSAPVEQQGADAAKEMQRTVTVEAAEKQLEKPKMTFDAGNNKPQKVLYGTQEKPHRTNDGTAAPRMSYSQESTFHKPQPQNDRQYYERSSSRPPLLTGRNLVILIVMLAVLTLFVVLIFTAGKVTVPDFTNWSRNDYMLWASQNNMVTLVDEQYSDTVPIEKVISQNVPRDTKVKKHSAVGIVISLGPDLSVTLQLPDLKSMTSDQVQQWASTNFMTKVRITTEYNDTVPAGQVIRFEINDTTVVSEVRRDTPIYVYVSKGSEDAASIQVELPDFKTTGISEAVIFAQENGLQLDIKEQYDDYVPKNSIVSQEPKAKVKVNKGSTVTVIVSLGKKIMVPDFGDYSMEQAPSKAAELGIMVTVKQRYSSSTSAGGFLSQSVEEGTEYTSDMNITLYYSLGTKIQVASYVGQQKNVMEQWVNAENQKSAKLTLNVSYTQNEAESGVIIQQSSANSYVSRGATLNILVSTGQKIFMPDFVVDPSTGYSTAITREKAQKMCDDAGLICIFTPEATTGRLQGEVWYQSIAAGTEVTKGATVTLKYNPVTSTLTVPDFKTLGLTESQIATTYGNQYELTFEHASTYDPLTAVVQSQSVLANTTVAPGTKITITLG